MVEHERLSLWTTDPPKNWPAPPDQMSVTALMDIETCPRRWALRTAEYPDLWAGRGYPARTHLSALTGTVVHLMLKTITKEFARVGCTSVQSGLAPNVMKGLGGYTRIVSDIIEEVLNRSAESPRVAKIRDYTARALRAQIPALRARVQTMLSRLRLPENAGAAASCARKSKRGPLRNGVFPEIELQAAAIRWKGQADLLYLSPGNCEITDFKTGAHDEEHHFQIQVYALLWSRDDELNPGRRLADRLTLRYPDGDVQVAAPTAIELEEFERLLVARRDAVDRIASRHPPKARPDAESCRYCEVRHLCDSYWTADTQLLLAERARDQRFTDVDVTITGKHGPLSWDAIVESYRDIPHGTTAVVRTAINAPFQVGQELRMLNVGVSLDNEVESQLVVITLGALSEIFAVS